MPRKLLSVIVVLLALPAVMLAQDWSQWRGPSRDGTVPTASTPATWPAKLQSSWRVEIGEGYSSPVVSGNRVFVHSRRDPEELVTALDLATGKILWQQKYAASFSKNQYASKMAKGPNSTPLVSGQRLFTLGVTGILSTWNTADGKLLWRKDYSASVDTSKLFCGTAMSPLIEGGALIVQVGSDIHGGRTCTPHGRSRTSRRNTRRTRTSHPSGSSSAAESPRAATHREPVAFPHGRPHHRQQHFLF
jgi:hypothetical protein